MWRGHIRRLGTPTVIVRLDTRSLLRVSRSANASTTHPQCAPQASSRKVVLNQASVMGRTSDLPNCKECAAVRAAGAAPLYAGPCFRIRARPRSIRYWPRCVPSRHARAAAILSPPLPPSPNSKPRPARRDDEHIDGARSARREAPPYSHNAAARTPRGWNERVPGARRGVCGGFTRNRATVLKSPDPTLDDRASDRTVYSRVTRPACTQTLFAETNGGHATGFCVSSTAMTRGHITDLER